jgi:hypothetical protein
VSAIKLTESELDANLESLLPQLGLKLLGRELKLGAYRFDAVAHNGEGDLVVVELKVVASKDTLGQLLLYPHALRKLLTERGLHGTQVKALLIATHMDLNVVEIAAEIASSSLIGFRVCVDNNQGGLRLVSPYDAPQQAWDQSKQGAPVGFDDVFAFVRSNA